MPRRRAYYILGTSAPSVATAIMMARDDPHHHEHCDVPPNRLYCIPNTVMSSIPVDKDPCSQCQRRLSYRRRHRTTTAPTSTFGGNYSDPNDHDNKQHDTSNSLCLHRIKKERRPFQDISTPRCKLDLMINGSK